MNSQLFARSPYLESHHRDKIEWNVWSEETLKRAEIEDKPLFISIGYYSCHWCHVMQELCFNDSDIAKLLNDNFINIIVDREERPDIDDFYMRASQIINGSGGWPLNVVALPNGKPFYITTFMPPRSSDNQLGLYDTLESLNKIWKEERGRIIEASDEILLILLRKPGEDKQTFSYQEINDMLYNIYDRRYGGFGSSPKFPNFTYIQFLMAYDRYVKKNVNLSKVERTLRSILNGGIYDQIGGGLHRYSTDEKWQIPHFEKMLYDQGMLLETVVQFTATYGNKFILNEAKRLIDFLFREMNKDGLFLSAIDSDFNGEEGYYYLWGSNEIREILGENGTLFLRNFFDFIVYNNKIILRKKYIDVSPEDEIMIKDFLDKLRKEREKRGEINKDDKIILSWNALVLIGMIHYSYFDNSYMEKIEKAIGIIENKFVNGNSILRTYRGEQKGVDGQLEDYAYLSLLFLEMYCYTIEEKYLNSAIEIAMIINEKFRDEKNGGFFKVPKNFNSPLTRAKEEYDTVMPSGISILYNLLSKLAVLTGIQEMNEMAFSLKNFMKNSIQINPIAHTSLISYYMDSEHTLRLEMDNNSTSIFKEKRNGLPYQFLYLPKVSENFNICNFNSCIANFRDLDSMLEYIKK